MSDMTHADRLYRYAVSSDSTKADHLASAAKYIQHLEAENQRLIVMLSGWYEMWNDGSNPDGDLLADTLETLQEGEG
jgi:hypothetical protein